MNLLLYPSRAYPLAYGQGQGHAKGYPLVSPPQAIGLRHDIPRPSAQEPRPPIDQHQAPYGTLVQYDYLCP